MANPGSRDPSLLTLQANHRSTAIWNDENFKVLSCRRADSLSLWKQEDDDADQPDVDRRVLEYVVNAGLYGLHRVFRLKLDHAVINALVERWREETHTFHLPVGEATVTLEDIQILTGLPIDGMAVTSNDIGMNKEGWRQLCLQLLGRLPEEETIYKGSIKVHWLAQNFRTLPDNATELQVQQYARAYIFTLIGGCLLCDTAQNRIKLHILPLLANLNNLGQYSWGSACLALLYRYLCVGSRSNSSAIGGPLIILQIWAWERIIVMRPVRLQEDDDSWKVEAVREGDEELPVSPWGARWNVPLSYIDVTKHVLKAYRDQLDRLKVDQFIWMPYTPDVIVQLPPYCLADHGIWRTRAPMICYEIVEWHYPDRVMRQFGLRQPIPIAPERDLSHHGVTRQGSYTTQWALHHRVHIDMWDDRHNRVVDGEPGGAYIIFDQEYLRWYQSITRLYIQNPKHLVHSGYDSSSSRYLLNLIGDVCHRYSPYIDPQASGTDRLAMAMSELSMGVGRIGHSMQEYAPEYQQPPAPEYQEPPVAHNEGSSSSFHQAHPMPTQYQWPTTSTQHIGSSSQFTGAPSSSQYYGGSYTSDFLAPTDIFGTPQAPQRPTHVIHQQFGEVSPIPMGSTFHSPPPFSFAPATLVYPPPPPRVEQEVVGEIEGGDGTGRGTQVRGRGSRSCRDRRGRGGRGGPDDDIDHSEPPARPKRIRRSTHCGTSSR